MAHNLGSLWAEDIASGLGAGLQALTQHKMEEIKQQKLRNSLQNLPKEAQDFIMYTAQYDPKNFHKLIPLLQGIPMQGNQQQENPIQNMQGLGQQQTQQQNGLNMLNNQPSSMGQNQQQMMKLASPKNLFGQSISSGGGINNEALEKRKDKIRPELTYLEDLERTLHELRYLLNDQKDPVDFGFKSSIGSAIPIIGNHLLSSNTGAFNALSDKFHTDANEKAKGVRSVYHLKILKGSKPGLDKTKEQNKKLLDIWDKQISEKKAKFLKAHPEFSDEVEFLDQQNQNLDLSTDIKNQNNPVVNKKKHRIQKDSKGNIYIDGELVPTKKG